MQKQNGGHVYSKDYLIEICNNMVNMTGYECLITKIAADYPNIRLRGNAEGSS